MRSFIKIWIRFFAIAYTNRRTDNSAKNIQTIQPVLQNARFERKKKLELEQFFGLRSPVGALRRFAAITGSKFRIQSYPLLASSQHIGATAAVTIIGSIVCILLADCLNFKSTELSLAELSGRDTNNLKTNFRSHLFQFIN